MMRSIDANRLKKQKLLILLCFLAYAFAYAGRNSYSANMYSIMGHYNITQETAGWVNSFFFVSYGAGQLLNAFLCKFYPKRYVVAGALWISAAINLCFFFLPPFEYFKYLWMINGICQSVLWPCLILTIGETIDESLTKPAMFITSISGLTGTLIAYSGSSLINISDAPLAFRFSFLLGTVLPLAIGLVWFFSYNVLTESKYVAEKAIAPEQTSRDRKQSAIHAMLGLLAVCAIFAAIDNFVKDGLNNWSTVILEKQFHLGNSVSILLTLVFPLCGVLGSVVAMQGNKILKDFRTLIGALYLILSGCLLGVIWALRLDSVVLTLIFFGFVSCLANGINTVLLSVMPLALRDRVNTGFLAGFMNACCYTGSAISGSGLGKIADGGSWELAIWILLIVSAFAALLAGVVMLLKLICRKKVSGTSIA